MPLLFLASLLWSLSFALIGANEIDPNLLTAARLGLAFLAFAPMTFSRRAPHKPGKTRAIQLVLIGALQYGLMYFLVHQAYGFLKGYEVALMTITTPLYVVFVEGYVSRHPPARVWGAAALAVAAALALRMDSLGESLGGANYWKGVGLVQGANLAWATGLVLYRKLESPSTATPGRFGWMFLGGFLFAAPVAFGTVSASDLDLTGSEIGVIAYLGLIPSALAFFLWNRGATQVGVGTLAVMNNLKVPLAVAVALLPPFSEAADGWPLATSFALLGAALILGTRGAGRADAAD
ncbi:MAG: EamA family transporter [Planctomycetota bacterium]|nr:EamA family transporter [Planctomycetota bacterium]